MRLLWLCLIVALFINIGGFLLFLVGFFPSKPVLTGFNVDDSVLNWAQFDKVVVVVIDALRADFLFGDQSNFNFVHDLIRQNEAVPFTAFSNPPTVTLPRLKGITLGTTPSFLDVILNIADDKDDSQGLMNQDNWLYQFKHSKKNKKCVMNFFGDDTWLKLFPDFFDETDGTNSFYVSDFYDVDNNVTRHLDQQLGPKGNWDGLFLHYLGLDHIGHKTGPNSRFMSDKQAEMDAIIKRIYTSIGSDTLMVVMGDHGMNEVGNHGGSSPGETSAGMAFLSPKFSKLNLNLKAPLPLNSDYTYYDRINQIDLIPTVCLLLGLPIPKNNLGIIIDSFLPLYSLKQFHTIVWRNCLQMLDLARLSFGSASAAFKEFTDLLDNATSTKDYLVDYQFLREVQGHLIGSASNYKYDYIHLAIIICLIVCGYVLFKYNQFLDLMGFSRYQYVMFEVSVALYSLHFHGSSFIEEEHLIWWFMAIIFLVCFFKLINYRNKFNWVVIMLSLRTLKAWSNSGQKYFSSYTVGSYLASNEGLLWSLNIFTYIFLALIIYFQGSLRHCFNFTINERSVPLLYFKNDYNNVFAFVAICVVASISFLFKFLQAYIDGYPVPSWLNWYLFWNLESFNVGDTADKDLLQQTVMNLSQFFFLAIAGLIAIRVGFKYLRGFKIGVISDVVNLVTLLLVHQTKTELIPVFSLFMIMKLSIGRILLKEQNLFSDVTQLVFTMTIWNIVVSNLSFFLTGGTNLLATVDLSNAYNGVSNYQIEIVSVLTFVSNFSGPIFWSLSTVQLIFETNLVAFNLKQFNNDIIFVGRDFASKVLKLKFLISLVFYSCGLLSLIASCYNLRYHLFIWTVFSPKLLYFLVWFVLVNTFIDIGVCTMVVMT